MIRRDETRRHVVAQTPRSGTWVHYFREWYGDVPAWVSRRDLALRLDEETARGLVDRFDARYRCPASGLRHHVEILP